ncbi:MAG TPA: hypothetical protein DDW20_00390 [Firmicutes bacterium]|nr:hypothetical protein [Bacillota bacterium]
MISKEQFDLVYTHLNPPKRLNKDFVFECYKYANEGADNLIQNNAFGKVVPVNPVVLILYILHEYNYFFEVNKNVVEDESLLSKIVSISLDKYFTNEHLNFKNETIVSKYSPEMSTLTTYLNFVLNVLSKVSRKNPNETLFVDILNKGFSMCKAMIELMEDGFETEAFSTWRTIHETECVLILLAKYDKEIRQTYLKHINYAMAFRGVIQDKEKVDQIFVQIKEEMKNLNLKSKDMKKYIEYGWLSKIPNFNENPQFKFNFRDGVESLAGLSHYSKTYELASEIAHSSPMLIYSKNSYFYHVAILNLYESFFRLENLFANIYQRNVSEEENKRFLMMKEVYYTNLRIIYEREKVIFKGLSNTNTK